MTSPYSEPASHAIADINERSPLLLTNNYARNMQILMQMCAISDPQQGITSIIDPAPAGSPEFQLAEKSRAFEDYYRTNLFNKIIHTTDYLSDSNTVELISPNKLGKATHSGDLDSDIGNTNYVFASADLLRSNSSPRGGTEYEIVNRNCHVVPMDIGHMHVHDFKDGEEELLAVYSSNIYNYEDFVRFFSTYTALLFDTPAQAIEFFQRHNWYPDQADSWTEESYSYKDPREQSILRQMSYLYINKGVIPPISPEFQFRDSVIGKRIIDQ